MTGLENIGNLAATASELLDAIRGGEIANMKAEHVQVLEEFETAYNQAISNFNTEKNQKLNEFNNQKTSALNDLASRANNVIANVESYLADARDTQSHFRLTKNQALRASEGGGYPVNWSTGYIKSAQIIERVKTGDEPSTRSALAQEFLSAINSNTKNFAGSFDIWELEIYQNRNNGQDSSYFLYQYFRAPTTVTIAAIVKHISGVLPHGSWCHGLEMNQPAKLCGQYRGVSDNRNAYSHCHPFINGDGQGETTVIQVALPAVVSGKVDLSKGAWGQFPYIGENAYD